MARANEARSVYQNNSNNDFNLNSNNNLNNNTRFVSNNPDLKGQILFKKLTSKENLELAFKKARKRKTLKNYVITFERNLEENLNNLRIELITKTYKPKPLEAFIIKDPKTRKISKSDFRDRIIHHAICNIIEPIFEKTFIYDSYANRKGKGTLKAIKRFDQFKRKASKNNTKKTFVLKADIKQYFQNVNHKILISLIKKKIKDKNTISLIELILKNHCSKTKNHGMPLGNLTSQFFANIYLDKLDQYVKHKLKAKYYIRYVDDFIIINNSKRELETQKNKINKFLKTKLKLKLHPEKTNIKNLKRGISFLGLRIFYFHKLLKKKNIRKVKRKINFLIKQFNKKIINYDKIYDFLEGWSNYTKISNSYKLRKTFLKNISQKFLGECSTKELNRARYL